ncbi:MAG TPA: hypothetical protein VEI03_04695 [Stellaceae bacterium]|nr:hypothetical protein [Stellaceae bacterium]
MPELQDLTDQQVTDALMKLLSEEEDGDSMAGMARGGEAAVEAVGSAAAASIGDTSQLLPLLLEGKA